MNPKKTPRIAAASVLVACMLVAVAALGGVSHAQNVTPAQDAYGKKVTICHKGKKTISISKSAWPAHQRHGDTLGSCSSAAAKKAKAAKIKAAKIKAAKIKAAKIKAAKIKAAKAKAEKAKAAAEKKKDASERGENPGKGKGKGGKG